MQLLTKILIRLKRIIVFKKGIYGRIGKKNKFTKGVFLSGGGSIGKYNYIGPYCMINNAEIGNYCSLGPNVKLGQAEHSKDFWTTSQIISKKMINHSLNKSKTVIGNDVWLAANVVVLQGVKIGDGVIVGANAVVTKNLPPYSIAVGTPAKVIKYRFNEEKIEKLQMSQWHQKDLDKAIQLLDKL
ncbi:CatB-related O-acetyltransferase [Mammaliicoccus sp. P-M57]|uniref:CatB-related O-acetyltransferase n=1 Tax=Mammaliicoccus sp. P-M57 TaxID=2898716 RepID=UPI001EFC2540|nr:CatB-related O-acetyltransferase [Mammaliicoccus sp. P-M57]